MGKKIDLTNKKFGKLLVLEEVPERRNKKIYWKCKCDCGNIKEISGSDLKSGKIVSCGCKKAEQIIDITGQRFNRLVALYPLKERLNNVVVWHCKCDCGNECDVRGTHLRAGTIQSCGCYNKEQVSNRSKLNLLDRQFGYLTVIKETNERRNGRVVWLCECKCGKKIKTTSENLLRGDRISCGCLTDSWGVTIIKKLLEENKINYIAEKTFEDCIYPETQTHLRFDFFIDNKYLLEFDGQQHFTYTKNPKSNSWNNKEHFLRTQQRDQFKNNWCKKNNIPLIRISYQNTAIKLEDLLLETTKYRVV